MKKFFKSSYMALIMLFIYIPIMILILFSFNSGESMSIFNGFSDRWYKQLANEQPFLQSIIVSVFTAIIATVVSVIIGTLAAIGLSRARRVTQKMTLSITNIPLINADIITAVSLMMLFIALGANFGMLTLVLAHISFDVPYVIITVLPRLRKVDPKLIEASLDLGAKPSQTLRKIILPILKPAIIAAAAIAFAMSFDDFIISYFTGGDDVNVATFIYTMKRIKPFINAFGTICIAIIGVVIIGWNGWNVYKINYNKFRREMLKGTYKDKDIMRYEKKLALLYHQLNNKKINNEKQKEQLRWKIVRLEKKYDKSVLWIKNKKQTFIERQETKENINKISRKKFRWLAKSWKPLSLATISVGSIVLLTAVYIKNNIYDLAVANWGEYITSDLIRDFEKKYNVKIKYSVYDSNETLYNKLYTTHYDVMVPSDYMVNKLAQEGRLEEIDYQKLNDVDKNFNIIKPNPNYHGQDVTERTMGNEYFNDLNVDIATVQKTNPEFYQNCIVPSTLDPTTSKCFDKNYAASLVNGLLNVLNKNKLKKVILQSGESEVTQKTIVNYSLPYFWGEVSLVINPTESNLNFLNDIFAKANQNLPTTAQGKFGYQREKWASSANRDQIKLNDVKNNNVISNGISWDILWQAAAANKRVLINNDPRNLFMLTSEKNYFKPVPTTQMEVDHGYNELATLLKHNNVALMNDELINAVGDGHFDFAFMYNGDAIYADTLFAKSHQKASGTKLIITRPRATKAWTPETIEGTNIWSDNMVLSKNARNRDLAYKFMNFIIQNSSALTEEANYTSPYQQVMDYENNYNYYSNGHDPESGAMVNYQRDYVPVAKLNKKGMYVAQPEMADGPFEITDLDSYVLNKYNILIAGKN
ncbi:ABC transporter permease subunit [Spiroplasma melliferum]|uniref:Spermidine/putrescine ABC transporter permease n=2 Tax=Spiroplasma melliferum TaxID=2134 RepID=A0AAI9T2Y1_SPIME|nr:extracellular solute-binding protein [Spiroplasma melliferum]ELL44489.1 spermidine/putrescine ABC transporter permease [Spiroplasma melliferum IPMB4A]KAI92418.1 spermidine/putrescine ABC transporter permease [Spiroplasma melliferum KC3]QCO23378.1 spermidine/putrescine ABC transporter permease [Spiroplasma melliferum]